MDLIFTLFFFRCQKGLDPFSLAWSTSSQLRVWMVSLPSSTLRNSFAKLSLLSQVTQISLLSPMCMKLIWVALEALKDEQKRHEVLMSAFSELTAMVNPTSLFDSFGNELRNVPCPLPLPLPLPLFLRLPPPYRGLFHNLHSLRVLSLGFRCLLALPKAFGGSMGHCVAHFPSFQCPCANAFEPIHFSAQFADPSLWAAPAYLFI